MKLGLRFYPVVPDNNVTAVLHYYHLLISHLLLVSMNNLKHEINIYIWVRLQHISHQQKLNVSDYPGALAASTRHEIVSCKPTYCILHLGALAPSTRPRLVSRVTTYNIPCSGPAQPS